MTTQIQFPAELLNPGEFTATVQDNNGAPATVLEAGQIINISVSWTISPLAALLLGGQWEVSAYVESMGPGPEQQVGPTRILPLNGNTAFADTITVPANTLPNNPVPPNSGIYKVVTVLLHRNFGTVSNVAAVEETAAVRIG